jgi:8-oxo-dGTP pyrophosphatase MutT (NUDIX family)
MKYPQIKNRELHRIVSTAIIHTNKAFPGLWTVPGGGLEIDDYINTKPTTPKEKIWYFALETSLRREVNEETGLEIGKVSYLLDLAFIRPDDIPVITLSFYAPWKKGVVKLDKTENTEFAWVSRKDLKKYNLIEGIPEEIKMVDKIIT